MNNITIGPGFIITHECARFTLTASGKSYKSKPDNIERETVDNNFYNNFISWNKFFNSRVTRAYTYAGYIPVKITTVNPWTREKRIDVFTFDLAR